MNTTEKALIYPLRFWTEYKINPDNPKQTKEEDWVEWGKKGLSRTSTTQVQIIRLKTRKTREGNDVQALEWEVLKPHYLAWKKGEEAPLNGTPLAGWAGASKELISALKEIHILTLEDFVNAPDHVFNKVALPKLRHIREQAKNWLNSKNAQHGLETEVLALKAELKKLKEQNAEPKTNPGETKTPAKRTNRKKPDFL